MEQSISDKTIIILLILAIVTSAIGTWTVMEYVSSANDIALPIPPESTNNQAQAMVSLRINPPQNGSIK